MQTSVGSLALIGAVLVAGSAMAQAADPRGPGRDSPAPAESREGNLANGAVGTTPAVGGALRSPAPKTTGPTAGELTTSTSPTYTTGDFTTPQMLRAADPRKAYIYIKIDAALPLQACAARGGAVVRHEGVQQCRLPAAG